MITASAVNGTEIFEIVVTNPDNQKAELIANTIADVLPKKIANIVEGSSVRIVDLSLIHICGGWSRLSQLLKNRIKTNSFVFLGSKTGRTHPMRPPCFFQNR